MRLTFCGAARTVTGSQHLVEVNGQRILLDCGLFQGARAQTYERNLHFPFEPSEIDLLVLSHAHIDHSGNIPNLVKQGFRGDIITTFATRDLCASMLMDSAHIHESDAQFVNKRRAKRGEPPVDPLYTREDAAASLEYFVTQGYDRPRRIAPGVTLTFRDAGHMLGSAIVVLDIEDRDTHRSYRLVFSGDLGREGIPIIRDPESVDRADILIMESTYGNRLHPPYADEDERLKDIIVETYRRGGSIVIPAFAVGRTQQLVISLHQLALSGDIPDMPIFVDSPLATDITAVYRLHPECYDAEMREFLLNNNRRDPFGFDQLTYTRSVNESKRLNFLKEPAIIISASGMAENGRILHHLRNKITDSRTTVLIVGFQAENTLGRRLVEGAKTVRIFGEEVRNHAHVEVLEGFSGHADRDELLQWVGDMREKPKRTFLVHGETQSALALADSVRAKFGMTVDVPEWKQSFEVMTDGE
jgi:metallo-beta-lactamase family protein